MWEKLSKCIRPPECLFMTWFLSCLWQVQLILDILNADIWKYSFYQEFSLATIPTFINISTSVMSNYWYLKVSFLVPENLLWDISSLGWTLRYQELTVVARYSITCTCLVSVFVGFGGINFVWSFQVYFCFMTLHRQAKHHSPWNSF